METRKVQVTGGSTYIISIPKKWATSVGIDANSTLGFIPQSDGNLLLTPNVVETREERKRIFNLTNEGPEFLLRKLIGAYMMGYDVIEVKSKSRIPNEVREMVRTFTKMAIGPEIVDESLDHVVTKDLLDPSELTFDTTIRRMVRIVEHMHNNAITAMKEGEHKIAEDIISRDAEVDRLYWLVSRQYNTLVREIALAEKMETTRERSVNYLLIARSIERIGDHATKIAHNVIRIQDAEIELDKKMKKKLEDLSDQSLTIFTNSVNSLFRKDLELANKTINEAGEFLNHCDKFQQSLFGEKMESGVPMGYILESIRRSGLYSRDICEGVINFLVDLE